MSKQRYSVHTFMFPFQWDYIPKSPQENTLYNRRTNLKDFDRLFSENSPLKRKKFDISNSVIKYSEYSYFHPYVRKALYHTREDDIVYYYEIDEKEGVYNIEYLKNKEVCALSLKLDNVCLHAYDTGVGVLTFNLSNYDYPNKEDILIINEYGRRIYPQYMNSWGRLTAKNSILADRISGNIGRLSFSDDFSQYEEPIQNNSCFLPPQHIRNVFGYSEQAHIGDEGQNFVFRNQEEKKDTIRIRPVTDDRMFYLCYYNNAALANEMASKKSATPCAPSDIQYEYELNEFWYAMVYGDSGSPSVKDDRFQQKQIRDVTYSRWVDFHAKEPSYHGSLFGITKDSFVCIGGWSDLETHMQTMYYQMAILCLVQRASILRFSYEIAQITRLIFKKRVDLASHIKEIYENYITFINRIYFREVTAQIQGIELYAQFQNVMILEKEIKDLDGEIQELFEYQSIQEQGKLNKIAALFLPVTLVTSFLGMNIVDKLCIPDWLSIALNITILVVMIYVFVRFFNDTVKFKK